MTPIAQLFSAVLFGAVGLAGVAMAQDATTPADANASEAVGGAAAAQDVDSGDTGENSEADAGTDTAAPAAGETPVTEGPEEGETYVAETFGDWSFACVRSGTGNDPCRFTQTLENGDGGRVAQVSVVPLPAGEPIAAAAIIETPLGTLLRVPRNAEELSQPGGLRMRVDQSEVRVFQFTYCNSGGCVAEIGMEDELVTAFKRGNVATLTIWSADAPGQPVELPLSLSGFTAGYDRVAALANNSKP